MNCPFCKSDLLRNSQYRAEDFFQLLLLRLPVRCRGCQERSYVSIPASRRIRRESQVRHEERNRRASPKTQTESHSN
jgi:hypothetical protein